MGKIRSAALTEAIKKADSMTLIESEKYLDEINCKQPLLMKSVIDLHYEGNSLEQVDVIVGLLIVTSLALEYSDIIIEEVSMTDYEIQMNSYVNHLKRIDVLKSKKKKVEIQKYIKSNPEKLLMAYVYGKINEAGLTKLNTEGAKYLVMAGVNIVNCVAAKTEKLDKYESEVSH